MNHEAIETLLKSIAHHMMDLNRQLAEGIAADMTQCDRDVKTLCEEIAKLTPQEAQRYAEPLRALGTDLQSMQDIMIRKRDELKRAVKGVNNQQHAASVYTRAIQLMTKE